MQTLRSLPVKRAALGDDEHQRGLRETEALLLSRLKELGYTPDVQKIEWVSPVQRLGKSGENKAGDGKPAQDPPDQKKTAEGASPEGKSPPPTGESKEHTAPARSTPPAPEAEKGPPPEFWNNIVVDIPGRELPGEVVLIGAHFDAVARTPGADDNGSGTAALMELARVLKDHPMKRTVRLVFFNLEEIGLVGSRQYVATHTAQKSDEHIVGMVSLEMIGYYCTEEGCQKSPIAPIKGVFEPSTKGDNLAAVTVQVHQEFNKRFTEAFEAGSDGLKIIRFDFLPVPIPDILRSDHAPFLAQGVPAIMLTDTSNFRNPNYHKPWDTVETLDQDRYVRAVRGVVSATLGMAEEAAVQGADAPSRALPGKANRPNAK